jgi:hypothetical protein
MPQTSIRLNDEIWAALDRVIVQTGESRTALIQKALEQFLGLASSGAGSSDNAQVIEAIVDRLDRLEATVFASHQDPPAHPEHIPSIPTASQAYPPDGLTQKAVLATIGVSRSTARDRAKKAGLSLAEWIEANSRYRRSGKLWISQ